MKSRVANITFSASSLLTSRVLSRSSTFVKSGARRFYSSRGLTSYRSGSRYGDSLPGMLISGDTHTPKSRPHTLSPLLSPSV